MKGWGKWIGALIGFALFNFIGGFIGYVIGSLFDRRGAVEWDENFTSRQRYSGQQAYEQTATGDFAASLLVLTAAVMKADGQVLKSELEYVRRFYVQQFGEAKTKQQMVALRDILKQPVDARNIGHQIRYQMQYASRLQLVHYLFGIAQADGNISPSEVVTIQRIAGFLGIGLADFESIKAMFVRQTGSDYKILEVTQDASDEELKMAYRKM
ncbi:MAG: TerB family tellurite resistance protein, partial [Flavobacteriales bacterium]|nr:TerB family tellurite resistance protein [Flavobacteriales bacterium]